MPICVTYCRELALAAVGLDSISWGTFHPLQFCVFFFEQKQGKWLQTRRGQPSYKEEVFYSKGDEAVAEVAQRGGKCPVPGDIQGQAGPGSV